MCFDALGQCFGLYIDIDISLQKNKKNCAKEVFNFPITAIRI